VTPNTCSAASAGRDEAVNIRRHTHTHTFASNKSHTHTTTLHRIVNAGGHYGAPVTSNVDAFFGEISHQVGLINNTLDALKARCEHHKVEEMRPEPPREGDTIALRRALGHSAAAQMDYYLACMQVWTGLTAEQHLQFCDTMMTAMKNWHTWTPTEQKTFVELFSKATVEGKA
jgi:hypothetical protein